MPTSRLQSKCCANTSEAKSDVFTPSSDVSNQSEANHQQPVSRIWQIITYSSLGLNLLLFLVVVGESFFTFQPRRLCGSAL